MQKRVVIKLSEQDWPEAMSTVRNAKAKGYALTVFDLGLPPDGKAKLQDLKVSLTPQTGTVFDLASVVESGERCFFGDGDPEPHFAEKGLTCRATNDSLASLVIPAASIKKRAEAANLIEAAVVANYGGLLSADSLCGDDQDWQKYAGFFRFLTENGYFQPSFSGERMALNLYAVFFPENITVLKG